MPVARRTLVLVGPRAMISAAAVTAGDGRWPDLRVVAQVLQENLREAGDRAEPVGIGMTAAGVDGGEDLQGRFVAKTGQGRDAAVFAGGRELRDARDVELLVEGTDFFGPKPLQLKKIEQGGRELRLEALVIFQPAVADELGDLAGDGLADARDLHKALIAGHLLDIAGVSLHRAGGVCIGAGLEGVLAFQLQQLADGLERLGDFKFGRHSPAMLGAARAACTAEKKGYSSERCCLLAHILTSLFAFSVQRPGV